MGCYLRPMLDYCKALDCINHKRLLFELSEYGTAGNLRKRIEYSLRASMPDIARLASLVADIIMCVCVCV